MKLRFTYIFLFIAFGLRLFGQQSNGAQDLSKTIIRDEFYDNIPLADILDDLNKKYKIPFKYNKEALKTYKVYVWFVSQTVPEGLKTALKGTNLKFYVDEDFTINVVHKSQRVEKAYEQPFTGKPTRSNFNLTGRVIDGITGETLPFASISVKNTRIGGQTNVDGLFTLLKVPSDTVTIETTYIGYIKRKIQLTPNHNYDNFIIELDAADAMLEEVVVAGEKTEVVKANEVVGMIKMTPKNIAKLPNVGERDPFRAFQLMPGVSASNESSSGLYVRGGTPDQTLVLYDGFTVYHVDHLFGFFSAFNYNAIKDIQLYKGGFDSKFGGRISGVAEITGKDGNKNTFNAGADVSLLSVNGYIETPIGKNTTFLVAARRSYKGPLYNKIFKKFTEKSTTATQQVGPSGGGFGGRGGGFGAFAQEQTAASYFYDINSKLTYRPSKKDVLSLSFYNGTDDMDNSTSSSFSIPNRSGASGSLGNLNSSSADVSNWGNTGGSFKWSRQWGNKLYSNSLLSYSNYFSKRDNSRNISVPTQNSTTRNIKLGQLEDNDLTDFTGKIDFEYKISGVNRLEFGTQITQNQIKYTYSQNDTVKVLDRNDRGRTTAFYLQDKIRLLNNRLNITPGIRATHFDITGKTYYEPRITANLNITEKLKLKGAAGIYYQMVKQVNREDISSGNRNFWVMANSSSLPVTKSEHLILGTSYETKDYLLDVEFYQKKNFGITEYTLRFVPQIGVGLKADETFFNGNETIQGVDVLLQKKFGSFTGWLGYTLSEGKRVVEAFSSKPYYSDQDVRHQFKAVASRKIKNWDLAATFLYSTGRPYTSIIGAYSVEVLDGSTRDFTNPSDKNANRFNDYQRLDFSATYNFNQNFNIGFSVFNALNRTNTWYKRFEIINEDGVSYLSTTNVNYLGLTPNIILSWKLK